MKGYDFRAARVLQTAKKLLAAERLKHEPPWLRTVSDNPPAHILVRTQPVQHVGYGRQRSKHKLRKQYIPQRITYPEDRLRRQFFEDHPWELARPRILLERSRGDTGNDWDKIRPEGLALQPENVIQRQLWLIEHGGQDPQTAYDTARREFYHERFREDIERKVAKEEALHAGAYFKKSTIAWGMELEDRKFHGFKQWAGKRAVKLENMRQSQLLGGDEVMLAITDPDKGYDAEAAAEELIERDKAPSESQSTLSSSAHNKSAARSPRRPFRQPVSGFAPPEAEDDDGGGSGGASLRL